MARLCIRSDPICSDPIRSVPFRSGHPSVPLVNSCCQDAQSPCLLKPYSFPITHENNCTNPNTSPTKTYDSYTWPDSVAPSTNVTPVPLTYHAGWLPKVKKAVPVSDRVLRSHVANKLVAKLSFD